MTARLRRVISAYALALVGVLGIVGATATVRDHRGPIPFGVPPETLGQIVFDPIPGTPPTSPPRPSPSPTLDPPYPLWDPDTPTYPTLASECSPLPAAPPMLYADDPETWNTTNWVSHKAVELEREQISGSGLIYWYFLNSFPTLTHLYVGTANSSGSFQFIDAHSEQGGGASAFAMAGAVASRSFLSNFVPGTGFTSSPAGTGSTPTSFITLPVQPNQVVQGEAYVTGLASGTNVYVYADNCATGCPDVSFPAPSEIKNGKPIHRRGLFPFAGFFVPNNYTEALFDAGSGYAYNDLFRPPVPPPHPRATPYPASIFPCAPPLIGMSSIDQKTTSLKGNYGVPVTMTGHSLFMNVGEVWYIGSRGGGPFEVANYLHGFVDPTSRATIPDGAYLLPCSNCLAPNPTPTTMDKGSGGGTAAAVIGLNGNGVDRSIVYIQSGFDPSPVRMYYLDPTP